MKYQRYTERAKEITALQFDPIWKQNSDVAFEFLKFPHVTGINTVFAKWNWQYGYQAKELTIQYHYGEMECGKGNKEKYLIMKSITVKNFHYLVYEEGREPYTMGNMEFEEKYKEIK